jgi:hypothetical protein
MRRLHLEQRREEGLEDTPLIEAKAVEDDEHRRAVMLEQWKHELADDVDRERGPLPLEVGEPARVRLGHVSGERAPQVAGEPPQGVGEPRLPRLDEIEVPLRELAVALDPGTPVLRLAEHLHLPEALDECPRDGLLPEARAVQDLRDRREHLAGMDRLDEVVAHVGADGFGERRFRFALRHHDDGQVGRDLAQLAKGLESALPRHLLIEEHDVEGPAAKQLRRIVRVGGPLDVVALLAQEDAVRLEKLRFVVHPENRLRRLCHALKLRGC